MKRGKFAAAIALMPVMTSAISVQAQDAGPVESYKLPPGPKTDTNSTVAGPVDAQHPVARPTAAAPVQNTPTPTIVLPPELGQPRAERAIRPRVQPALPQRPSNRPVADTPVRPVPAQPSNGPIAASPVPGPLPETSVAPASQATPVAQPPGEANPWLWLALAVVVAALLGGLFMIFRRRPDQAELEPAPAIPRAPAPPSPPASEPSPAPVQVAPDREQATIASPIAVKLEAEALSGSLFYATLSYRLTVVNHGTMGTGPLHLSGDMISAHASIDPQDQLAPDVASLIPQHDIPSLASGDDAVVTGTLRMPLSAIVPMAGGTAFVPLARFHVASADDCDPALGETRIFVFGPAGEAGEETLLPFRFAQLPGVVKGLGQREIRAAT